MRRLGAAAILVCACGGTPPPPERAPKPAASSAVRAEPAKAPDLTPVARPGSVVLVGRVPTPGAAFDRIADWRRAGSWSSAVDEMAEGTGEHADPNASFDVLVAVEEKPAGPIPEVYAAASVGLRSLDGPLASLSSRDAVRPAGPGIHRVGTRCALAAAAGAAPARLVCGSSRDALDLLLPYAIRGVVREPPPAQPRFELDVARLRALHGERLERLERYALPLLSVALGQADRRLDRALSPLLRSAYGELVAIVGDVDHVALELRFEREHAEVELVTKLGRDAKSFFGKTLVETDARQAPAPAELWRLPRSAHFAVYSHGMGAERAQVLRATIAGALSRGARSAVPRQTIDLVVDALFPEPPFVYAFGLLDPPRPRRDGRANHVRWRSQRVLGWHLTAIETDPVALGKKLDRGMNEYNSGPLRALVYGEFTNLCAGLPKITKRPARGGKLPKGSTVYEMLVPGKLFEDCVRWYAGPSKRPTEPLGVAVVFAPGKPRSWLAIAPDTAFAQALVETAIAGGGPRTLAEKKSELALLDAKSAFGIVASSELVVSSLMDGGERLENWDEPRSHVATSVTIADARTVVAKTVLPRELFER